MSAFANVQIRVSELLYIRDPEKTELGENIVKQGIELLDRMGYEQFTFKKLAKEIGSTEASIYRYFVNKHKLLSYLMSWYWGYMEYLVDYHTHNLEGGWAKLSKAFEMLGKPTAYFGSSVSLNAQALHRIAVAEYPKTYLTKDLSEKDSQTLFQELYSVCGQLAHMIQEVAPTYNKPMALSSTLLHSAYQQQYFSKFLSPLTELSNAEEDHVPLANFLMEMLQAVLRTHNQAHNQAEGNGAEALATNGNGAYHGNGFSGGNGHNKH